MSGSTWRTVGIVVVVWVVLNLVAYFVASSRARAMAPAAGDGGPTGARA